MSASTWWKLNILAPGQNEGDSFLFDFGELTRANLALQYMGCLDCLAVSLEIPLQRYTWKGFWMNQSMRLRMLLASSARSDPNAPSISSVTSSIRSAGRPQRYVRGSRHRRHRPSVPRPCYVRKGNWPQL